MLRFIKVVIIRANPIPVHSDIWHLLPPPPAYVTYFTGGSAYESSLKVISKIHYELILHLPLD